MARPFVPLGAAAFISLFIFSELGFYFAAAVCFAACTVFAVLIIFFKKSKKAAFVRLICIGAAISALGFGAKATLDYLPSVMLCDGEIHTVSGIVQEVEKEYGSYYYTLKNAATEVGGSAEIRVRSDYYINAEIDDTLTFYGVTPQLLVNEDNRSRALAEGVYLKCNAADSFAVEKAGSHSLSYYMASVRRYITDTLNEHMRGDLAAVANAVLTGDRSGLDSGVALSFGYAGLSHLFATSGFHLSLWTSLVGGLWGTFFTKRKRSRAVVSILFIVFFSALTGFTKSIMRASLMLFITLFGTLIKRQADGLNSLFLALTVLLWTDPFSSGSISLQMTFLATLGIILFSESLSVKLQTVRKKSGKKIFGKATTELLGIIAVSLSATLFTLPVTIFSFGYYSPVAPLSNLLCLLPAEGLIILAGAGVAFGWLGAVAQPVFFLASLLAKYAVFAADKLSRLTGAVTWVDSPLLRLAILGAFIALVACFISKVRGSRLPVRAAATFAAGLLVLSVFSTYYRLNSFSVTAVDVGNGTCVTVESGGSVYLIGCGGGRYRDGDFISFLNRSSKREIELLLIPRVQETECRYAYRVFDSFHVNAVVATEDTLPDRTAQSLPQNTALTNIYRVTLEDGTRLAYLNSDEFSGVRIESDALSCTVVFMPGSDFSAVPESWSAGDLLITRAALPKGDTTDFDNIFISGVQSIQADGERIFSTATQGNLTFSLSPGGQKNIKGGS